MNLRITLLPLSLACLVYCNPKNQKIADSDKPKKETVVDSSAQSQKTSEDNSGEEESDRISKSDSVIHAIDELPPPVKKVKRRYPQITFEEEVFDFDTILSGVVIRHDFKFTNTGDFDLTIKGTKATCGCTTPSYPFIDIAPGESGVIGVEYNSVGKQGLQGATITVNSNAKRQSVKLRIKGYVANDLPD